MIVTGANSGIGKETAIGLARRGGKVYIACRNRERAEAALKEIKEKSGSDEVYFLLLDLASVDSINDFVKKFQQLEPKLDILVNNAGVMGCSRSLTKDGFEMQFGTNHLGHFLLTNLLLDLLKASAPSRIVFVSGLAHRFGSINREDLNSERSYWKFKAYCQSKLANNLFCHELNKRIDGTGVTVNCLHPGIIYTEIVRHLPTLAFIRFVLEPIARQFLKTAEEGAQTTICVAVDPDLEKVSGKYFTNCKQMVSSATSRNDELSEWLWRKSEEMLKIRF